MHVVWLPRARAAREEAVEYIARDNPRAALRVLATTKTQTRRLADFPELGRPGVGETRELIIAGAPFIVIYRVRAPRIEIIDFIHVKQRQ